MASFGFWHKHHLTAAGVCVFLGWPGLPGKISVLPCVYLVSLVINDIRATTSYCVHNYHKRLVLRFAYSLFPYLHLVYYAGSYCAYSP